MSIIKIVNAQGGSDARYDVSQMTPQERANFDSDGRPRGADAPDQWTWTSGLPGAREMNAEGGGGGSYAGAGGDLMSSPYFQQALAAFKAQNAADEAATKAKLRQMLIDTGLVPQGFTDKLGILDAATRQLIEQNTQSGISQIARLNEGYADQKRNDINSLASSGLLRSGAKGFKLRRSSLAFDRNKADLLSGVTGAANDALSGFAQRTLQGQQSLAQFLAQLAATMSFNKGFGNPSYSLPQAPQPAQAQAQAPTSAPWAHLGIGVPDSQGYATKVGGGYYTNPQSGELTTKWQNLARMG